MRSVVICQVWYLPSAVLPWTDHFWNEALVAYRPRHDPSIIRIGEATYDREKGIWEMHGGSFSHQVDVVAWTPIVVTPLFERMLRVK